MTIAETIRKAIKQRGEGVPVMAREFLHLGSRAAIDQELWRLAKSGVLLRIRRGVYVRPIESRFGVRPPAAEKVVTALGKARGETVAPSGAATANTLGLTSQVPVRTIYLTSGRSERLRLGAQEVELRHAPAWELQKANGVSGQVLRALAWFRSEETEEQLLLLRGKLTTHSRRELSQMRISVPPRIAKKLGALIHA